MIDTSELVSKFYDGEEITIRFRYPSEDILISINSLIAKILAKIDLIFLLDTVITILREVILNAVKANAKRLFFENLELDINDHEVYQNGMKKFKDTVINDLECISNDLDSSNYRILMKMKKDKNGFQILINNNVKMLPGEIDRVNFRINTAIESEDFSEAYQHVYDPSEGAGLGITLTILLLKNAGIDPQAYRVWSENNSVTTSLSIPYELRPPDTTTRIKREILEKVDALPTFPEHIIELQSLCNNPDASIDTIASRIVVDPSLTADVLKISNSAGFITGKRIHNVHEAIMIIGLRNLNSILTVTAARKILERRYKKFEQIWTHCNKTAFYARTIASNLGLNSIVDFVFISGLLHDIGKIVLLSTDQSLVNQVSDMVENRKIRSSTILEEISIGISHSTIGALIANNWNFPDYLIEAINFHHSPLDADERYNDIVSVVYLANMFAGIEIKKYGISFIESEVLEKFNIRNNSILGLGERLKDRYEQHISLI